MRLPLHLMTVGHCRHCERMARRNGQWRSVAFPALVGLILHPRHGPILYDTGYAPHFVQATRPFPERLYRWTTPMHLPAEEVLATQLARHGLRPADIRWCVISHFHADHISGLRDLPEARFLCLRADYASLTQGTRVSRLRQGLLPALLPEDFSRRVRFADDCPPGDLDTAWQALGPSFDLFADGSLTGVPLPGHVPGQLGLHLHDQHGQEVFLCADAAWSRLAWQDLDLPAWPARRVMAHWPSYVQTLTQLRTLAQARPQLQVLPSHCARSLADYRAQCAQLSAAPAPARTRTGATATAEATRHTTNPAISP